jgi:3-deoxy-D-manno-octulosonic-acid transferase
VAVVNARISDRSWPRYRLLKGLWSPILRQISLVLAQSETDAERLMTIGCLPGRVTVAGNLKFDVRAAAEADATRLLKSLAAGLRIVVAGSTLEGEEAALLEAWPRLLAADPRLILVLAPRHPERFAAVAALLERSGIPWVKRSKLTANTQAVSGHDFSRAESTSYELRALAPNESPQPLSTAKELSAANDSTNIFRPGQIVLLDTIGELASVYSLAAVAFVGGSLIPSGGHNPLEPAQFGVPIVIGPHYANFRAITEDLLAHQALRIATKDDLASTLIALLQDSVSAQAMGERARQVFHQQAGATDRCVAALHELLSSPAVQERTT